jgi:hypothetical protein
MAIGSRSEFVQETDRGFQILEISVDLKISVIHSEFGIWNLQSAIDRFTANQPVWLTISAG